jgi:DNA-binding NtrC family response regulator
MRILVVDDDEIFCRFVVEALEDAGMPAICSSNGLAAFELMSREPCDLCIIDVRMPLVLGTELAEAIKAEYPGTKIILVSAFPDWLLQDQAKQKGYPLLSKPFSKSQLFDMIAFALHDSVAAH